MLDDGSCYQFIDRSSDTLIVAFSAISTPRGKFGYYDVLADVPDSVLFLNCPGNQWYLDGVPGLGSDLDSTVRSIERVAVNAGASRITMLGSSMGGYGAALYGSMLGEGVRVLATGAEVILNLGSSNSENWLKARAATALLDHMLTTQCRLDLLYGEWFAPDLVGALAAKRYGANVRTLKNLEHNIPPYLNKKYGLVNLIRDPRGTDLLDPSEIGSILQAPSIAFLMQRLHHAWRMGASTNEAILLREEARAIMSECADEHRPHAYHLLSHTEILCHSLRSAVRYAQMCCDMEPRFYLHFAHLASIHVKAGNFTDALEAVRRCKALEDTSTKRTAQNLKITEAQALIGLKREGEAKDILSIVLQERPAHGFAQRMMDNLS